MLTRRTAIVLTIVFTATYAICDFTAPGEITVAILYTSSVVASGWSRSHRFIWLTTVICVALSYAGLAYGPQPTVSVLWALYIDRSFVALSLLLIAAILHHRLNMTRSIEQTRDELRRVNEGLERQVESEVDRRLRAEESLHQAQKMEAMGQLTGGIAHDFNNILTIVIGNLEMIAARSALEDSRRQLAENALRGAEKGALLTNQLLSFARRQSLEPEVLEIERVLSDVVALARSAVSEQIELSLNIGANVWHCCVDEAQLQSAVLNLVINARDATPNKGRITISAGNATVSSDTADVVGGEYVLLSVEDTGSGMPPELLTRVFEPFFTTKGIGKGTGLGLAMVYGFAKQSGGTVRIESTLDRGTTVLLYLPRATSPIVIRATPRNSPPVGVRPATVLIVEDDDDVRQLTTDSLQEFGYRVLAVGDAAAALPLLEHKTVDLLFSDVVMPGTMTGFELASEARRLHKNLPVLLTTGYAEVMDGALAQGESFELLRKPFGPCTLATKIQRMLAGCP